MNIASYEPSKHFYFSFNSLDVQRISIAVAMPHILQKLSGLKSRLLDVVDAGTFFSRELSKAIFEESRHSVVLGVDHLGRSCLCLQVHPARLEIIQSEFAKEERSQGRRSGFV